MTHLHLVATVIAACLGAAAAPPADDALVRTRLLRLSGGAVVRAPSRLREGAWEVRRGETWTALPAGLVVAAPLESEVLAAARGRRLAARRQGPAARVELARWMAGEGLLVEAFRELDEVLGNDPDQPDALALLHARTLPVARPPVPSTDGPEPDVARRHHELLAFAGRAPPSLRELVVADLRAAGPDDALHAELRAALVAPDAGTRAFACLAGRRLFPDRPDPELLRRALLDTRAEVRHGAALALRDARDPEAAAACIANLAHVSSAVRTHAAETLGRLGAPEAIEPLVAHLVALHTPAGPAAGRATVFFGTQRAFVQGYEPQVAGSAVIARPVVGTVQDGVTLDARVLSTGAADGAGERRAVRLALEALTGASPGTSGAAWERWLARRGG